MKKYQILGGIVLLITSVVSAYTLSFPPTPLYKYMGGELKKVFNNISNTCGPGKYIQGINSDGVLNCKSVSYLSSAVLSNPQSNYNISGSGKYTTYLKNILNDCGNGRYLRGFDINKKMICSDMYKNIQIVGSNIPNLPLSLSYPSILTNSSYTNYFNTIFSNDCGINNAITGFNSNGLKTSCVQISQDGLCGASSGALLLSKPTTNLCSIGTPTTVTGDGPWNWQCTGINGGLNSSCKASIKLSCSNIINKKLFTFSGNIDHQLLLKIKVVTESGKSFYGGGNRISLENGVTSVNGVYQELQETMHGDLSSNINYSPLDYFSVNNVNLKSGVVNFVKVSGTVPSVVVTQQPDSTNDWTAILSFYTPKPGEQYINGYLYLSPILCGS